MSISNRYTSTGFVPVATANVKSASGASCSSGAGGASGASSASMAPTATSGVTTRGTTTYTARAPETSLAGTGPAATGPVSSNPVATPAATTPVSTAPAETPGVSNTPSVTGSNGAGTRHNYYARHDFYDKQGEPIPFANLSSDVKSAIIDQATSHVDFYFEQAVECLESAISINVSNLNGAYTNTSEVWDEEGYGGSGPESVTVKAKYRYSWDDNGNCTATKIGNYDFVDRKNLIDKRAVVLYDLLLDILKRQSGVDFNY